MACGALALALAAIPAVIWEEPLPLLWQKSTQTTQRVVPPPNDMPAPGVELRTKNWKLSWSGGIKIGIGRNQPEPPPVAAKVEIEAKQEQVRLQPHGTLKWFHAAAMLAGILTIVISGTAWVLEAERIPPAIGATCAVLAITWQYVLIGLVLGVAIAIALYILTHLHF